MYRKLLLIAVVAGLSNPGAQADPVHAVADGAYWHHASHWVFPEKIGGYVRVGVPQDVAGSEDAVAHYAYVDHGVRNTASVDVYRADSASAAGHEARPVAASTAEGAFTVSVGHAISGSRRIYNTGTEETSRFLGVYLMKAGEWRITIRITGSGLEAMDAFVRDQRWEALDGH
jgi:hypothetical protein